jgi:hypothetical protein
MNAVPWLTRIPFLAILACQPLLVTPVLAQEEDLQETLRRMEQLLQRQQAELEAQRRELAEQRTLIEQLQGAQQPAPGKDEISPSLTDEPTGEEKQLADTAADEAPAKTDEAPAEVAQDANIGRQQALAQLAKQEEEGTQESGMDTDAFRDDPSNTLYDEDFPGAWPLPGTTASMKIAGYVNLALVNSFDPVLISDRFIVGSIPPEGENAPGAKAGTEVTANQTRLNFEVREETKQGPLRAFIEADFAEDNDTFRLRHAFGQFRWVLAGKTWSTLMDIDSRPEEVDFEGINGMILARQAQARIFPNFGRSMSFKMSVEDPRTDVVNGNGARGRADIVLSMDRLPLGQLGSWNSRVAFIFRDLEADQISSGSDDTSTTDAMGWGITTSGRKSITKWGEEDYILWQLTYGKGVGRYLNDLNTVGGGDAVFDPEGKLRALPVFAGYVSYSHLWPKDWWFLKSWPGILRSNFIVSWVNIDNFDFQDDRNYNSTTRVSANLIYLPTRNVRFGTELLWGERKNKDGSKGDALQLQFSARYNF